MLYIRGHSQIYLGPVPQPPSVCGPLYHIVLLLVSKTDFTKDTLTLGHYSHTIWVLPLRQKPQVGRSFCWAGWLEWVIIIWRYLCCLPEPSSAPQRSWANLESNPYAPENWWPSKKPFPKSQRTSTRLYMWADVLEAPTVSISAFTKRVFARLICHSHREC